MSNNARVVASASGQGEIGSAQYFQALAARAELKHEGLDDVETGSTAGLEVGNDEVVVIMLSGDGGESPSGDDDEFGEAVEVHYG